MSSQRADQGFRLRVAVRGAVQGVGFRPFVFRLATDLGLRGWVKNSPQGVFIEVEGGRPKLEQFLLRLEKEHPPRSSIQSLESSWLDTVDYPLFEIRESETGGDKTALVLPDIATCFDCLREIFDPGNRRYFYPFTNCTNCGPRFSIIESLPYDRANSSMKCFRMCAQCQGEYDDPRDRRFHAQPNACPVCGPHLELWDAKGHALIASGETKKARYALQLAAEAIRAGKILAVKGLGGFHLMAAAHDEGVVRLLRERKHREEKPFALMFPSLESIQCFCEVLPFEERLLRSPEAPIVILRRLPKSLGSASYEISAYVAPGNPTLGVMLPYTPLHHLLLHSLGFPVIATSGNLSDEPICIDEHEALERLGGIADAFLIHNRPIVRHVDDSIARVMAGRELVLRRARGYAPLPIQLRIADSTMRNVLAVGGHLKNTIALSVGPQVFLSQHIGDLETEKAYEAFRRVIADFEKLYEVHPNAIVADAHPDYLSTKFACEVDVGMRSTQTPGRRPSGGLISIQHHVAHVLSCMAENDLNPPVLGVTWDGTGYGLDGTIWGGEFFLVKTSGWERVAHLRPFRLPGGEQAVKEPRRCALGLLFELLGESALARTDLAALQGFSPAEMGTLKTMLTRGLNSPLTSSAGRLFDAVSALVGLRSHIRFEGQAAMELEFAMHGIQAEEAYATHLTAPGQALSLETTHKVAKPPAHILDWAPMLQAVLEDLNHKLAPGQISARFHNGLVEGIVSVARHVAQEHVVLSGGCFQNRYLTERTIHRLRVEGFRPYWHQRVPPNDGGIALGQVLGALGKGGLSCQSWS